MADTPVKHTPDSLMASNDSDEMFYGHVWALTNAIAQAAVLDTVPNSQTKREKLRSTARKHVRWLAARAVVGVSDSQDLIKLITD